MSKRKHYDKKGRYSGYSKYSSSNGKCRHYSSKGAYRGYSQGKYRGGSGGGGGGNGGVILGDDGCWYLFGVCMVLGVIAKIYEHFHDWYLTR